MKVYAMNNYSLVLNSAIEKVQSGKTVDEIVDNIVQSANKELNYEVDFNFLYEKFDEFKKLSNDTYNYSDIEEIENAFQNTLKNFDIDTSNTILVEALRVLSSSDKLIKSDNIAYCVKINLLLSKVFEYKNAIEKYKMLNALSPLYGGIAVYSNNNISECIKPRLKALDEALYLTNEDSTISVSQNVLSEFNNNAYAMDFTYFSLNYIGKENINFNVIDERKFNILIDNRKFLNASSPLKIEDFFKSAQIDLLFLYKKNNFTDMLMNYKTKLSQAKIVDSINIIMEHYLDMPNSTVYTKCLSKAIQVKSYFFDMPIYEYRTKENIKLHPLFENEQEFSNFSRTIL